LHGLDIGIESLRVSYARHLRNLDGLEGSRRTLRELELQKCSALTSLTGVEMLEHLMILGENDCGAVNTLDPLRELRRLEEFSAWGNTKILDGDLSALAVLPVLKEVRMRDRREYRPRVAELELRSD
jgi:hypothetical protein